MIFLFSPVKWEFLALPELRDLGTGICPPLTDTSHALPRAEPCAHPAVCYLSWVCLLPLGAAAWGSGLCSQPELSSCVSWARDLIPWLLLTTNCPPSPVLAALISNNDHEECLSPRRKIFNCACAGTFQNLTVRNKPVVNCIVRMSSKSQASIQSGAVLPAMAGTGLLNGKTRGELWWQLHAFLIPFGEPWFIQCYLHS